MGKGGHDVQRQHSELTWDEVTKHKVKGDSWIVIDGDVYDISNFSYRHPGGRVINHYAGQDATEAYRAFHTDFTFVHKYMATMKVGRVAPKPRSDDDDIKEDFEQLRQTVHKMGLFKPDLFFFFLTVGQLVMFEVLAYCTMYYFGGATNWLAWLLAVAFLSTGQAQAGWSQHDFGHLSAFKSVFWNHMVHQFTMGFMKGASANWWNHLHNQHHSKPNVLNKDPDVGLAPIFALGEEMPKRLAKKKKTWPYNWQQKYFLAIGPPFLFPIFFQLTTIRHAILRKRWLDLIVMFVFYARICTMYSMLIGFWGACKFYFLVRVLESHWFMWVAQSNHIPMEIDFDHDRPWFTQQLMASCNIVDSWFNNWFTGHLNYQIEHHLFPTMPRHNLHKTTALVKSICAKHGIEFQNKQMSVAFMDILRALRHSGEVWEQSYRSYHKL